ncbi:MAG: preprotein translocase subunit SecA [Planctomycetota bacterium]
MLETLSDKALALLQRIFGNRNEKILAEIAPIVDQVNVLEDRAKPLSDDELRAKTDEFRDRLAKGETLDDLLPEAFAVVRESARRHVAMRHFDVQILGGVALHRGMIAEMVTGEGKTLVATLAAYLNALPGKGVHIVTVNDYLARRDRNWMGPVFEALGLSVGVIQARTPSEEKQAAYRCDITYGQNNEFGFDYLRDNMEIDPARCVQRELNYAIVDEVDSILIDEARTPLIISGPAYESTDKYYLADRVAKRLKETEHYEVKEKEGRVVLTEEGITRAQELAGVGSFYEGRNMDWPHHIDQALRAHRIFKLDRDYIVKDGQVVIVDEFTGRLMEGRVWSDGLHQAVEAKEGLKIKQENQTLGTITFQNYFRMHKKLAGMTGTAKTEETEFYKIYRLEVVVIPTNLPLRRSNLSDVIFLTQKEKYEAVVREISRMHALGRPLLVGTASIATSELLSSMLRSEGVPHEVLNAKQHEREALIIAKAGQPGNVTIATNMAGRGTDIVLGQGVAGLGGLHVLGSERHEARRIDNQLRGRAGRQGDPGSSQFFLSLEDDLMRKFGGERLKGILSKLGMGDGVDLQSGLVTRSIEKAQKRTEEFNFGIRKNLLEYDETKNKQRADIYSKRREILAGQGLKDTLLDMCADQLAGAVDLYCADEKRPDSWDLKGLAEWTAAQFALPLQPPALEGKSRPDLEQFLFAEVERAYAAKEAEVGPDEMREIERFLLLRTLDVKWKDHLHAIDQLERAVGLRSYGQKDPRLEFQRESWELFQQMTDSWSNDVSRMLFRLHRVEDASGLRSTWSVAEERHDELAQFESQKRAARAAAASEEKPEPFKHKAPKVGPNDPCACGSGRKYKKCCGRNV